jgi:hypothetical protein
MQLTYRGLNYNPASVNMPLIERKTTAKYRGVSYKINQCIEIPVQRQAELKYRGVSYRPGIGFS